MILPNHLLPVLVLPVCADLLRQLVLARLQFSLSLLPCARRHFVFFHAVHVHHEALQVSYPALERIDAAAVLVIVGKVGALAVRGLALAGLEGAVLLEGFGRRCGISGRFGVFAFLRHGVVRCDEVWDWEKLVDEGSRSLSGAQIALGRCHEPRLSLVSPSIGRDTMDKMRII
jgi:hypothetical protein